MKIALFVHCFFPNHFYGTETYTLSLAKNYQKWGYNVTVVSSVFQRERSGGEIHRYFWETIPVIEINKNFFPHSRIRETYYQPSMCNVLEAIVNEIKPDLIHITHLINHTAVLLEVTRRSNIPTYATFTDFFGFCFKNTLETANGDLCSGPSSSRTNCISCYLKDAFKDSYLSDCLNKKTIPIIEKVISKSLVVGTKKVGLLKSSRLKDMVDDLIQRPNALVDLYNICYKAAISPTHFLKRAYEKNGIHIPINELRFGIDIDRQPKPFRPHGHIPIIGYIGEISPHKGTDLIIEAFKKLPKNSSILKIYGFIDQSTNYTKKLKKISLNVDGIFFMGTFKQSLSSSIFQNLDLLVIPSRWYENSPLVLLNSLATHTPVLISNVEGMTEFLIEGKNGYSFKRGDVNDLMEKLRYMLQTPGLLSKLSLTTEYLRTTEIMAKETLDFYQTI